METRKRKKEDQNDPAVKLKKQWKDRGIVIMNSDFTGMSQNMYKFLLQKAQNMDDPELVEGGGTSSGRIHQSIHVDPKVEPTKACKKLLLGSGDNTLAEAIDRYIRVAFQGKIVYGARKAGPYAAYTSLLTCIDNVPGHYKVEDFSREVFEALVNTPDYYCHKLQRHLDKTERSYQRLVLDLAAGAHMNSACDFYLGAASLHLDMPIMLIKPKQCTDRRGMVHYEFYQEFLFPEDEERSPNEFKIWLVYNGVNYYTPFYSKELAEVILDGDPVMAQIQRSYQDVKNVANRLPQNTQINGAMQQICMHMRASALIASSVRFQSGVGDTSPVSQLPFPVDTGVVEEPIVRKRKATAAQGSASKKATTGPTPSTSQQQTTGATAPSFTSPIGSDRTDIELMEHQCHCGMAFDDKIALKRHIKVVHRNNYWACSGEWVWDDGTESRCPQVCRDKFNLWKHFRTQHQNRYLHYCPVDSCNWGTDERTALPQHIQNIHKRKPVADVASQQIKCPKCNKPFSQKNKMRTHLLICGNQDKPFPCSECDEAFRDRDRLRIHTNQKHPQKVGDRSAYYKCHFCPKEYTSISSRRRHMKGVHQK